jgi:DNA repair exonuclease SbcCD ATPase subunit
MKTFFDGAKETMVQVNWQVDKANKIVDSIYERFREEHGFRDLKPELFSTTKFQRELTLLYQRADEFRNSPVTTLTEQSFVVKKFFVNMVSHARNIFFKANEDAERWAKSAMGPLGARIKERKHQLESRLNNLRKAKESRDKLSENIQQLEAESVELSQQLKTIGSILEAIKAPVEEQQATQPVLKSVESAPRDASNRAAG